MRSTALAAGNASIIALPRAVRTITTISPDIPTLNAVAVVVMLIVYASGAPQTLGIALRSTLQPNNPRVAPASSVRAYLAGETGVLVVGPHVASAWTGGAASAVRANTALSFPVSVEIVASGANAWEYEARLLLIGPPR